MNQSPENPTRNKRRREDNRERGKTDAIEKGG